MAQAHNPLKLILIYTLTALLFSGCAAGPKSIKAGPSSSSHISAPTQKAMNAIEDDNYEKAAKIFDKLLQNKEDAQDEFRYEYGLALSKTGRYEEAIQQLTTYIDNFGPRGSNYSAALGERAITVEPATDQKDRESANAEVRPG